MLPCKLHMTSSAVRSLSTSWIRSARNTMTKDPGIGKRKRLLNLVSAEHDLVDVEDMEADLMEVHKTHKTYQQELAAQKERLKYLIVKQKHFKEKYPNFLTWSDKEQIRYLYRTDPEEWTIERLSDGFPALPDVIKKIVKGNWTKTKEHKITNHDAAVQNNWTLFKQGQLKELPEELVDHLNKFTNRSLNLQSYVKPKPPPKSSPVDGEFSQIISSYYKLKTEESPAPEASEHSLSEPAAPQPKRCSNSVTLDELQTRMRQKANAGESIDIDDALIAKMKVEETALGNVKSDLNEVSHKYPTSSGILHLKKTERDLSHLHYPDKITIPTNILKKGNIYKLNDCYYDDDGEFLYRVPGMG